MSTATNVSDTQKTQASDWFMALRDEIVAAFEALEVSHSKDHWPISRLEPRG